MGNFTSRQFRFFPLWALLSLAVLLPPAEASDVEKQIWVYFGANLGYTSVKPTDAIRESSRDGYASHLKVLGSKYWEKWVGDLGLGYQHHYASGVDRFSIRPNGTVNVRTRSLFLELSPRYRLDSNWQLGAAFNGFFGTDVAFGESTGADTESFVLAGGARVDYEMPGEEHRWRFGAQILHDLTVKNRGVWWVMADVQFGIPTMVGGDSPAAAEPEPAPVVVAPKRPVAPTFAEVTEQKGVKIYLGEAVLRFETASARLRPSSKQILVKVAKYLKKSPAAWKEMRVEGHADKRGKFAYNQRLSLARAQKVKSELATLGIPKKKVTAEGFGPTRPIDPAEDLEAYALNRRVELWLDGVTEPDVLVRDLNELK